MLPTPSSTLARACLVPLVLSAIRGPWQEPGPPSMALVPGGATWIGTTIDEVHTLAAGSQEAWSKLRSLDAETPRHRREVAPFFLMVTEVTNEQYAEFVRATGHRPPYEWADPEELDTARRNHLEAENEHKLEEAEQGRRYKVEPWAPEIWWGEHWEDRTWVVPPGRERAPVSRVDFDDARAYCAWAGLRLPTEFEFQRAGRGDGDAPFPWGAAWEDGRAVTSEQKLENALEVGSLPACQGSYGHHDLLGNHWEWTSSPYLPYPGYEGKHYECDRGRKFAIANWHGHQVVVVGGSFKSTTLTARITTRRPTDRDQITSALGFRAAATPQIARDVLEVLDRGRVQTSFYRNGARFDLDAAVGIEHWSTRESALPQAPAGYGVITGHDYLAFAPTARLDLTSDAELKRLSLERPVPLGFLATSQPILTPALPAGTFLVAYRGKGRFGPSTPADQLEQVDPQAECLLFFDASTDELIHVSKQSVHLTRPRSRTTLSLEASGDGPRILVNALIPTRIRSRAAKLDLELGISEATASLPWQGP